MRRLIHKKCKYRSREFYDYLKPARSIDKKERSNKKCYNQNDRCILCKFYIDNSTIVSNATAFYGGY